MSQRSPASLSPPSKAAGGGTYSTDHHISTPNRKTEFVSPVSSESGRFQRKQKIRGKELQMLRSKYDKFSEGSNQYLYGVKLERSVCDSWLESGSIATSTGGMGGRLKKKKKKRGSGAGRATAGDRRMRGTRAALHNFSVEDMPAIPSPSSPEVLTMTKTLLVRGGISGPERASMDDVRAYPSTGIVDLIDEQKVEVEKLKIKKGDVGAKRGFVKLMKEKSRLDGLSMDVGSWESHLPRYARRRVEKEKEREETEVEKVLRTLEEAGAGRLQGDDCMAPKVNKSRCQLCMMYFDKSSMTGVISMKSVMELQRNWGVAHDSKRYNAASFIYNKCKLCCFCSQMFDTRSRLARKFGSSHLNLNEAAKGYHFTIKDDVIAQATLQEKALEEMKERNLAVTGNASQSSTVDGKLATMAISGTLAAQPVEMCTRTRREFESWWEVELDCAYPVKAIHVYNRKNAGRAYKAAPFWVFLTSEPLTSARLSDSKRKAIRAALVSTDDEKVVWKLPQNSVGSCVRVQCEGIKSLQLAQVEIVKGGVDVANKADDAALGGAALDLAVADAPTSSATRAAAAAAAAAAAGGAALEQTPIMTTFSFDFIGAPFAKSKAANSPHSGTSAYPGRPFTAPNPSTTELNSLNSQSQSMLTSSLRPATASRWASSSIRRPPAAKPTRSLSESTQQVSALFDVTAASYGAKTTFVNQEADMLGKFNELEQEALQRNFLLFAQVPDLPRYSHPLELTKMTENYDISVDNAVAAIKALKAAGSSGPKSRNKEAFGLWEREEFRPDATLGSEPPASPSGSQYAEVFTEQAPMPHLVPSHAYSALVESYCVEDLLCALHDVEYSRKTLNLPPVRITFFEFLRIIECCMHRNLRLLGKVFHVPSNQIRNKIAEGDSLVDPASSVRRKSSLKMPLEISSSNNNRKSKEKKKVPQPLSLSTSLKHYSNPSATYSSSPVQLRRPKTANTGKTKLQRSEEVST